jgi:hypothetical protein
MARREPRYLQEQPIDLARASTAEASLHGYWAMLGGPQLAWRYWFDAGRRTEFDFAHPDSKTAIEVEGGVWSLGRHVRGAGYEADCAKYNRAAELGWVVFRFTPGMLDRDPMALLPVIRRCGGRGPGGDL